MLDESDLRAYLDAFNRNDFEGFSRFYAPDLTFVGRAAQLNGRDEVVRFYRTVKTRLRETITIHAVVAGTAQITSEPSAASVRPPAGSDTLRVPGGEAIVADLETRLEALEDWPDFPTGPLKRGEVRRSQNFIWYDVTDDRFTRIRAAHYRRLEAGETAEDTIARPDPGMTPKRFAAYIDAFNRDDYAEFGRCYQDDVVLVLGGKRELRGREAIFDFYRRVKSQTRRTIEILGVVSAGNQLAAELQSEFLALQDLPDFTAGPLMKGERLYMNTVVLYELRDGRFARIRSAPLVKRHRG